MDSMELRAGTDGYRNLLRLGHRYGSAPELRADASQRPTDGAPRWRAKRDSHDDGELSGLFLGGIGAPAMARDVDGRFRRWHLQPGYHVVQAIDAAFFSLRWNAPSSDGDTCRGYTRLAAAGPHAFADGTRSVYSLLPVTHENYHGPGLPWEATLELFSPLLVEEVSSWPVWIATITVTNRSEGPVAIDTALFWPNLLGWRAPRTTAVDRPERPWPGQTHAGNTACRLADLSRIEVADQTGGPAGRVEDSDVAAGLHGVLQQRNPDRPVRTGMEGEVALLSTGKPTDRRSIEACFKTGITRIDRPPERQGHTLPWVEEQFRHTGSLPQTGRTWTAHWDESIGSALHRGFDLAPGETQCVEYIVAFDIPLVQFGSERHWYRKYTARFGTDGRNAVSIAVAAAGRSREWRHETDRRQRETCGLRGTDALPDGGAQPEAQIPVGAAAMLNELYFINGGGTLWVDRWADEIDGHLPAPLLGSGEHAAILEGYDVGYYYYNTTDLWPYAWYAIYRWWSSFARNVFNDLLTTIPLEIPEERVYYRTETVAPLLVRGKLPHDVGSPMGDPWHRINGYQMRDDSNLWKDHNPAFILSYYLFARLESRQISTREWAVLKEAGRFFLDQDTDRDGLPRHDEFGDSTWDNLGIEGLASYSGGVSLAALAALAAWATQFGDTTFEAACTERVRRGVVAYRNALWCDDGYFRLCDTGKYRDALMADAMIGFFLADLAGLGPRVLDLLPDGVTRAQFRSHMECVVRYNVDQYAVSEGAAAGVDTPTWLTTGRGAPLLVAAPGTTRYQGDGGDELQVNEVLVGSAWMTVAILEHVGLTEEAQGIAGTLEAAIYGAEEPSGPRSGRGLQFRTPAAIDGRYNFRAPMNMRPLAVWFLEPARLSAEHKLRRPRILNQQETDR
ncbi:MAG: GH116 family glycosyl hydrolase [Alkalispirochaeta sp.]